MNTAARLGAYALGLAVVFGGALGVGAAVGETAGETAAPAPRGHDTAQQGHDAASPAAEQSHDTPHASAEQPASDTPGGLQVSEGGYTLTPLTTGIKPGERTEFTFTVTGPDGRPVTGYDVAHDKKMHFIVVSRDLGSFGHLHPEMSPDGVWSVKMTFPAAGPYRAFADFAPTGRSGLTLGADLFVAGDYHPQELEPVNRTAEVDDYTVNLDGDLVPGQASRLTLTVSKDGEPVTDLQPYLGAYGHLVALRAGDLAYLHVHPDDTGTAGSRIAFDAQVPSGGAYRLFLDFKHGDVVRTADFTANAGPAPTVATPAATPSATPAATHGDADHGH
ncbi:hypothetical protein [Nonomuraea cavernae]|uniref:hypothetical protein n=1 Tax=Nonomuraea cavernae TaxID=2045107 RepID=UPI0033C0D9DE